jgi:uncharacterized lipoprotein NlpE involved in copper resistance
MKVKTILLGLITVMFLSCNSNKKEEVEATPVTIENEFEHKYLPKVTFDYLATYKGTLPCADCEGIKTTIRLASEKKFEIEMTYLGEDGKVFPDMGQYYWNEDGKIITLKGDHFIGKFLVNEDNLLQLDKNGAIIEGKLASNYKLMKEKVGNNVQ